MERNQVIRYGEAFKRQVVDQIETGKLRNIADANRTYGIRGTMTVKNWLKHYGSGKCLPKQIKIMSLDEIDENKELKKRVRALESSLADTQMRNLLNESYLEIACERMDTDAETFKKKHATELSGVPRRKDRQ